MKKVLVGFICFLLVAGALTALSYDIREAINARTLPATITGTQYFNAKLEYPTRFQMQHPIRVTIAVDDPKHVVDSRTYNKQDDISISWDSATVPNGPHVLFMDAYYGNLKIGSQQKPVVVYNNGPGLN